MVTVKLWGQNWKGKKIVINCDNASSVRVLNTGFSRDLFMQSCLREICFFASIFEFQIRAKEISGLCENRIPDYLSRWDSDPKFETLFYSSVAGLRLKECVVNDDLFSFTHDWYIVTV